MSFLLRRVCILLTNLITRALRKFLVILESSLALNYASAPPEASVTRSRRKFKSTMLFHAAVALACGVLLSPAIDSTQAMEIFRNGQEAVGLSRVELSAESSALDLRETGKIACLQRRGLVSRRLKLIRRCQEKGLGDLEPEKSLGKDEEKFGHDDASHLMEPKAEESASQQGFGKGNPNPAFAVRQIDHILHMILVVMRKNIMMNLDSRDTNWA